MVEQSLDRQKRRESERIWTQRKYLILTVTDRYLCRGSYKGSDWDHSMKGENPALSLQNVPSLRHLTTSGALEMHLYYTDTEIYMDTCLVFENTRSLNSSSLFFSQTLYFFDVIVSCHVLSPVYF